MDFGERVVQLALTCYLYQACLPARGRLLPGLANLTHLREL